MNLKEKEAKLIEILNGLDNAALAFSGGVDSTYLLYIAQKILGDRLVAVTAVSSTYPERESNEAREYAASLGVRQIIIESEELDITGFSSNPSNRCYYCKKELYGRILSSVKELGISTIIDGANADDTGDYRPGMQAAKECGAISPLLDAMLTKDDIRTLSKEASLPTWNKPSFACLASRFPYGTTITKDKLKMVEKSEQYLMDLGFKQIRVRHHGNIARIEVAPNERDRFFDTKLMDEIGKTLQSFGYAYVTLDLLGYRTGSLNEVL